MVRPCKVMTKVVVLEHVSFRYGKLEVMRFVFVLEDDAKFMKEIAEAILQTDALIQVRQFKNLNSFVEWVKILLRDGVSAVKIGGKPPEGFVFAPVGDSELPVLQLVITKIEYLGARQLGMMKKTRDLFVRTKVCTLEDPTSFVLTAFEDPNFHIDDLRDRILSNILMKPFDRLILQQHLTYALDGRHPPSKQAITPYKTNAFIESLKIVHMEMISEVGFVTRSNRLLPLGAVAKYYSPSFLSERQKSIIAKLVNCSVDPQNPAEFLACFAYFGADTTQIHNIRRQVLLKKNTSAVSPLSQRSTPHRSKVRIIMVEERQEVVSILAPALKRKIKGAEILLFENLQDFLIELDPKLAKQEAPPSAERASVETVKKTEDSSSESKHAVSAIEPLPPKRDLSQGWDFLFVSHRFSGPERVGLWTQVLEKAKQLTASSPTGGGDQSESPLFKMLMVAGAEYSDEQERSLAAIFDDLIFLPVERLYLLQKMLLMAPHLKILDDPIETHSIPCSEQIKAARPIEIEELSEAGLTMKYDRAVSLGSFREFVLWQPYEVGAPEINATVNFTEESSTKGTYRLHFVFFAMKDMLLKSIRTWILENYARAKQKSS